jgi:hypothetical protein
MKVFTTPKIHELVSTAGKNPSVVPSASGVQTATFLLNTLPTGKAGRFWYYVQALLVKMSVVVTQAGGAGSVINPDKLWKCLASVGVQTPILGELYPHRNTRGAVLGNIIQTLGMGYQAFPLNAQVAAANGNTTVTLFYRIPFAMEILKKSHETSPWTGMLEGGTVEVKCDLNSVLSADSTGVTIAAPCNFRAWLELQPQPEAVIHTPAHWREYLLPGSTTRHQLLDMGSPDGLKGVDISKGAGLAFLGLLHNPTGLGLGGATTFDTITGVDVPWRDQDRIDAPDAFLASLYAMKKRSVSSGGGGVKGTTIGNDFGFPYSIAQGNSADFANAGDGGASGLMYFPIVNPGYEIETSKLQSVKGARDINITYSATPAGQQRFLSLEFPVFDEGFSEGLKDLLLGGHVPGATLGPKTLNKQVGGVHGTGKLAYVRQKVSV